MAKCAAVVQCCIRPDPLFAVAFCTSNCWLGQASAPTHFSTIRSFTISTQFCLVLSRNGFLGAARCFDDPHTTLSLQIQKQTIESCTLLFPYLLGSTAAFYDWCPSKCYCRELLFTIFQSGWLVFSCGSRRSSFGSLGLA